MQTELRDFVNTKGVVGNYKIISSLSISQEAAITITNSYSSVRVSSFCALLFDFSDSILPPAVYLIVTIQITVWGQFIAKRSIPISTTIIITDKLFILLYTQFYFINAQRKASQWSSRTQMANNNKNRYNLFIYFSFFLFSLLFSFHSFIIIG